MSLRRNIANSQQIAALQKPCRARSHSRRAPHRHAALAPVAVWRQAELGERLRHCVTLRAEVVDGARFPGGRDLAAEFALRAVPPCPIRVNHVNSAMSSLRPLLLLERRKSGRAGRSESGQQRTSTGESCNVSCPIVSFSPRPPTTCLQTAAGELGKPPERAASHWGALFDCPGNACPPTQNGL